MRQPAGFPSEVREAPHWQTPVPASHRGGTEGRGRWNPHDQLWPWLRVLIATAAVAGLVGCSLWVTEARDNFVPFPQGAICKGEPRDDCITKTTGTVIDKRTRTFCTGGNQDTGPSCSIAHLVGVRFGGAPRITSSARTSTRTWAEATARTAKRGAESW